MNDILQFVTLPVTLFGIFAMMAMSLQLILGGAGLLSLGHAAYFAVGGYASGAFAIFAAPELGITHPVLLLLCGVTAGAMAAAIAGALVAIPCLRLSGDYLAMATLGFGEIVSTAFKNLEIVGGTRGFKDIPKLGSPLSIWIGVALMALLLKRFYKSDLGFAVLATRDDEIAARSVGIATHRAKMLAFVLGSALAGVAGSFYAHTLQIMTPDSAAFIQSVEIVLAVVIGGMYSLWGSVLGAFILIVLPEVLRFAPDSVSQNRMLFFSLIVIVLMIVRPKGLASLFEQLKRKSAPVAGG